MIYGIEVGKVYVGTQNGKHFKVAEENSNNYMKVHFLKVVCLETGKTYIYEKNTFSHLDMEEVIQ